MLLRAIKDHFLSLAVNALRIGNYPADSQEDRLRKTLLVGGSYMVILATAIYGTIYYYFNEPVAASISWLYTIVTALSLYRLARTGRYRFHRFNQLALGLFLPFCHMLVLGGFMNSSAVLLWSFISPTGALLLYESGQAMRWWYAYVAILIVSGFLDPLVRAGNNLPPGLITTFFVLNIIGVSSIVIVFLKYFLDQKELAYRLLRIEETKAQDLLLNILPREIAGILKDEKRTIADHFEGTSVLFADLVGFTSLTAELAPVEMVNLLNEIFSFFDSLVEKYDVEKIRTIGDNYMVAAGAPRPRPDHAQVMAWMALEMSDYLRTRPNYNGKRIEFRIGINSGPAVGGVIGRKKFVYDLWGDAVNIASRMESQGVPGKIQITDATYEQIRDGFICEPRGTIPIKGKGEMRTWFLVGVKALTSSPSSEIG